MIKINVEDTLGNRNAIEVPTDISLSLMEVLKASEYPVEATCGGMALCATCHVEVVEGEHHTQPTDAEMDMFDTLPTVTPCSRLACQMRIHDNMDGLVVRLVQETS